MCVSTRAARLSATAVGALLARPALQFGAASRREDTAIMDELEALRARLACRDPSPALLAARFAIFVTVVAPEAAAPRAPGVLHLVARFGVGRVGRQDADHAATLAPEV